MEQILLTLIIITIVFLCYIIPFLFLKGKKKVYITLGLGCIIFYTLSTILVLTFSFFELDNGEHQIVNLISIAIFVLYPYMVISNLIIATLFWLYKIVKEKTKHKEM